MRRRKRFIGNIFMQKIWSVIDGAVNCSDSLSYKKEVL